MGVLNKEALSVNSPDRLVREAYGTMGPVPTACTAAMHHAGNELLTPFPIFQDVTENTACLILICILDDTVLSVHVLAGQMATHCHDSGDGDGTARGMFKTMTCILNCLWILLSLPYIWLISM
uniref:Uncharacterized protein n=1 Tax=Neolamprologus brichardi TaxID=32507 RepID=A0A3Q4GXD9_NEOBR